MNSLLGKEGTQNVIANVMASICAKCGKSLMCAATVFACALARARFQRVLGKRAVQLGHGLQYPPRKRGSPITNEGVGVRRYALADLAQGANALLPVSCTGGNAAFAVNKVDHLK